MSYLLIAFPRCRCDGGLLTKGYALPLGSDHSCPTGSGTQNENGRPDGRPFPSALLNLRRSYDLMKPVFLTAFSVSLAPTALSVGPSGAMPLLPLRI